VNQGPCDHLARQCGHPPASGDRKRQHQRGARAVSHAGQSSDPVHRAGISRYLPLSRAAYWAKRETAVSVRYAPASAARTTAPMRPVISAKTTGPRQSSRRPTRTRNHTAYIWGPHLVHAGDLSCDSPARRCPSARGIARDFARKAASPPPRGVSNPPPRACPGGEQRGEAAGRWLPGAEPHHRLMGHIAKYGWSRMRPNSILGPPSRSAAVCAFSLTSLDAQRDAGYGDGRSGQPFTAAQWRSALPRRSPAWPSAGGCEERR
jgi:hypothetical protein